MMHVRWSKEGTHTEPAYHGFVDGSLTYVVEKGSFLPDILNGAITYWSAFSIDEGKRRFVEQGHSPEYLCAVCEVNYRKKLKAQKPMRLWLVERTDNPDYQEYANAVVRARSENEVRTIVLENDESLAPYGAKCPGFTKDNLKITLLTADGDAGVITGNYHT